MGHWNVESSMGESTGWVNFPNGSIPQSMGATRISVVGLRFFWSDWAQGLLIDGHVANFDLAAIYKQANAATAPTNGIRF